MNKKNIAIVIPARLSSTRLPEKCLLPFGKYNIIQSVYLKACEAGFGKVIVACDHEKIVNSIENIGGEAIITSPDCQSGTDRITEILEKIPQDYIVNIQGDEPFISKELIFSVAEPLFHNNTMMTTLAKRSNSSKKENNPNLVKVVTDKNGYALYFSRSLIPFPRDIENVEFLAHIGIYGYSKSFLNIFSNLPKGKLEDLEKLEQLRVLENGYKIKVSVVEYNGIGIDTKEDYERALKLLENGGIK